METNIELRTIQVTRTSKRILKVRLGGNGNKSYHVPLLHAYMFKCHIPASKDVALLECSYMAAVPVTWMHGI